jgi:hypothetical protein
VNAKSIARTDSTIEVLIPSILPSIPVFDHKRFDRSQVMGGEAIRVA